MYTLSSLSTLLLSLSEVLDSSPFLPAKQSSSDSIPSCNMYFATSAENCCMRHACGGSGAGVGGVSSLHMRFRVIGVFRFAGFIISSGNFYLLNHKDISSPSVFLIHPRVQGSICISQWPVQCLYW